MKRDLRKAEEEEKWREKANNRDQWKRITKVAVHRSDKYTSLTPTQGKPEEEKKYTGNEKRKRMLAQYHIHLDPKYFRNTAHVSLDTNTTKNLTFNSKSQHHIYRLPNLYQCLKAAKKLTLPISLLPQFSKILEKLFLTRTNSFFMCQQHFKFESIRVPHTFVYVTDVSETNTQNTSMCSNDTNKISDADHY